jgi:hypothetical protein
MRIGIGLPNPIPGTDGPRIRQSRKSTRSTVWRTRSCRRRAGPAIPGRVRGSVPTSLTAGA